MSAPGEARAETSALKDHVVFDANGERVGKVTSSLMRNGRLEACQVTLDNVVRRTLGTEHKVATLPVAAIQEVVPGEVRLRVAAAQVVLDEERIPADRIDADAKPGASGPPRKIR